MNALDDNPDALANANAALTKRRQMRREAMQHGDLGSPIAPLLTDAECGPLHFQPIPCTGCGVKLTSQNHGNAKQCELCFTKAQTLMRFNEAQRKYVESKAKWSVWDWALVLFAAVAVAAYIGEAVAMAFWWMGGGK